MTMHARHAISVDALGNKVAGDSGTSSYRISQGLLTLTLATPLRPSDTGAILFTRRGTGFRYFAEVQHTSQLVKRVVIRDTSLTVTDSPFDVLIYASGSPSAELSRHSVGSVVGSTGAKYAGNTSFTPARTGTGVYTLTLATACPAANCIVQVTRRGSPVRHHPAVEHTSDTVKTVRFVGPGAAALDADFDFAVWAVT